MIRPTLEAAHPEIPVGSYCYGAGGVCPHMGTKEVAGVSLAWCGLLQRGSIPNGITEAEYEALKAHYGTHSWTSSDTGETFQALNDHADTELFLLWDQCKECGINDGRCMRERDHPNHLHGLTAEGWRRPFPVTLRSSKHLSATGRLREIWRQMGRLAKTLAPIVKGAPLVLEAGGDKGVRARLGHPGEMLRLAAHLARVRR